MSLINQIGYELGLTKEEKIKSKTVNQDTGVVISRKLEDKLIEVPIPKMVGDNLFYDMTIEKISVPCLGIKVKDKILETNKYYHYKKFKIGEIVDVSYITTKKEISDYLLDDFNKKHSKMKTILTITDIKKHNCL